MMCELKDAAVFRRGHCRRNSVVARDDRAKVTEAALPAAVPGV